MSQIFRDLQRSEKDRTETNAQIINAHFVLIFEGRNPEINGKVSVLKNWHFGQYPKFLSKSDILFENRNFGQKSKV